MARSSGWVLLFIAGGLALAVLPFLLAQAARLPVGRVMEGTNGLLLQALAQLAAFGFLTWAIGHRFLRMSWPDLGWVREHRVTGFLLGLLGAALLAFGAMLVSVLGSDAHWLRDSGGAAEAVARAVHGPERPAHARTFRPVRARTQGNMLKSLV